MRKERQITIKVIENKTINKNRLVEFFARKYSERMMDRQEEQNQKS